MLLWQKLPQPGANIQADFICEAATGNERVVLLCVILHFFTSASLSAGASDTGMLLVQEHAREKLAGKRLPCPVNH